MKPEDKTAPESTDRRDFLQVASTVGGGIALANSAIDPAESLAAEFVDKPKQNVRVGVIGIGARGRHLLRLLLGLKVEVPAVCDVIASRATFAQDAVAKAGQTKPTAYTRGEKDFERMCEHEQLDLVIAATPWKWHVPMCVAAMKAGKHAATEVPAAITTEGCWKLVETAEKTKRNCIMLENCCYGRTEMMVLNMVRRGLLGQIVHAEAGYMHEYRRGWVGWRKDHSDTRNGNQYPTHGLGPVAQCLNIDRGDRFDYLVSMSTRSSGMNEYYRQKLGDKHPLATQKYAQGDVNVSLIRTVNGASITLGYDVQLPRPYSRINLVQGTKGIVQGYPERISIEGKGNDHSWKSLADYRKEYDHPLWKKTQEEAKGKGHGGMDYVMMYRLINAFRNGTPQDMDVYDAASWSVICALSEKSVANRSRPVDFPDFTKGKWRKRSPLGIVSG